MTITTITKTLDYVTEAHTGAASAPLPTDQSTTEPQGEFERFEDLTGRLVQVPKTEVDEKRD